MIETRSFPAIVKKATDFHCWSKGTVTQHTQTPTNKIGQTSLASICDDIITIVMSSENEAAAFKNLHKFFLEGEVK